MLRPANHTGWAVHGYYSLAGPRTAQERTAQELGERNFSKGRQARKDRPRYWTLDIKVKKLLCGVRASSRKEGKDTRRSTETATGTAASRRKRQMQQVRPVATGVP